ncbi:NYN domain-containing protein [Psychrosphaera sp.]|nr:NYN domain-containing protein [Psychrosphaera sp.]
MSSLGNIAIFVDVQNIYYTTKQTFNRSFDYRAFWKDMSANGNIVTAIAYAIDSNNDGQRKFQDALRHIGFDVKLKPYIQRADGSAKGDWDVGITIDVLDSAPDIDTVVLMSGDGDFELLLRTITTRHKCKTYVVGVEKLTANLLIDAADIYMPIDSKWLK